MRKDQKSTLVSQLAENLDRASIALISEHSGMSAGQSDDMRRRIRAVRGEFRVAKNTLMRRAIKDTRFASLERHLGGPVGLILSYADPVELAKTVGSFKDLGEKFKVRGGVLDGQPLTPEEINALAALPPREVILGQLLGLLQAPATQLVRLLNEPGTLVARLVDAIGRQRGDAPEPTAAAAAESAPVESAPAAAEAPVEAAPAAQAEAAAAAVPTDAAAATAAPVPDAPVPDTNDPPSGGGEPTA
ncbi:MAG: 50S ribosomal protein L10 [Candidatus Binataceae bacterium]|nr:50S ribosomal protein L10 [Candidatus Binataceae bacterium]